MSADPATNQAQDSEDADGPGLPLFDIARFLVRAARRHWVMGLSISVVIGSLATFVASQLPPFFESFARVSVPPNMVAATALGRTLETVDPLKGVEDVVFRDDNLASLEEELKLVEAWDKGRSPLFRAKDRVMEAFFGTVGKKDKARQIRTVLKNSIAVGTSVGAITFRAEWSDPKTAFDLCRIVKRNFLGRRSAEELAAITTAMTVLDEELKRAAQAIDPALEGARKAHEGARQAIRAQTPTEAPAPVAVAGVRRPAATPPPPVDTGKQVSVKLDEVRRKQAAMRDPWQRRLAEERFELADLKATFGPEHPAVKQQEARVQAASATPPDLAELDQQERSLLSSLRVANTGDEPAVRSGGGGGARAPAQPAAVDFRERERRPSEDPAVIAAEGRLAAAVSKYNEMSAQLEVARLEYATAQAAFKYKYVTVSEPELATKPFKPKRAVIVLAGWVVALAAGFLAGGIKDLLSRRLLEGWQLRYLGVPVLAEIDARKRAS